MTAKSDKNKGIFFGSTESELETFFADLGQVTFDSNSLTIRNYPFDNSVVSANSKIGAEDIINICITTEADQTILTTSADIAYNITWQFDNSDKTELSYVIHAFGGGDFNVKLENIVLNENSFRYAELYSFSGTYAGGSIYREPKP